LFGTPPGWMKMFILLLFSNQFAPDSQQIFLVLSCGWRERGQVKICVSREGIIEILFSSK
jgi:hypothetical protein